MSILKNTVRSGFYLDSVALMRMSAELCAAAGVEQAVLMIGTDTNKEIMRNAGLLSGEGGGAGPGDLIIAVCCTDDASADAALEIASTLLEARSPASEGDGPGAPRSVSGALASQPDANLVLVSTPGAFAAREARAALRQGLNVMLFSDNVSLEEEIELKTEAHAAGLLVMGPDCGTAYLAGVPIAFANAVRQGDVGIVAASGTGLQEVAVQLHNAGLGLSHGIGVGGRDLSDDVGGISTLDAIDLLDADPSTKHILIISKPPGAKTTDAVFERLGRTTKPAYACMLGLDEARAAKASVPMATTLKGAAELIPGVKERLAAETGEEAPETTAKHGAIHGLYTGGTLCAEAQVIMSEAGIAAQSNAPVRKGIDLPDTHHVITDLGADEFTQGQPHPMLEPAVRVGPLTSSLQDSSVAVVLVDVVLGFGAHPNPAQAVVETIKAASGKAGPTVVAYVCGTDADPQGYAGQVKALRDVGVLVARSNSDAVHLAMRLSHV